LARIIVNNGDWDEACARLKTVLQGQDAAFNASLKATFAAPAKPAAAAPAPKAPARGAPARGGSSDLPRSKLRR
jgi:hypothetical protein